MKARIDENELKLDLSIIELSILHKMVKNFINIKHPENDLDSKLVVCCLLNLFTRLHMQSIMPFVRNTVSLSRIESLALHQAWIYDNDPYSDKDKDFMVMICSEINKFCNYK